MVDESWRREFTDFLDRLAASKGPVGAIDWNRFAVSNTILTTKSRKCAARPRISRPAPMPTSASSKLTGITVSTDVKPIATAMTKLFKSTY
jgi:hypothetical protein